MLNKKCQTNNEEFQSVKHQNEILPNFSMFVSCCHSHSCPGRRNVAVFFAGALWHLAEEASRKTDIGNAVLGLVPGSYVSFMALVLGWGWLGWVRIGVFDFFPKNTRVLPYNPPVRCFFLVGQVTLATPQAGAPKPLKPPSWHQRNATSSSFSAVPMRATHTAGGQTDAAVSLGKASGKGCMVLGNVRKWLKNLYLKC